MNISWQRIRRWGRWILPVFVLYFVYQRIDFIQFKENFLQTDPLLFFCALSLAPIGVFSGAFRWHSLLKLCYQFTIPLGFVIRHYWSGLALGFFVPASLGWDAYRVFVSGQRFGDYSLNVAVIIIEKIMALVACMSIIVILYPMLTTVVSPEIEKIFFLATVLLCAVVLFIASIIIILRSRFLSLVFAKIEYYSAQILEKISSRLGVKSNTKMKNFAFREMFVPLIKPKIIRVVC